MDLEEEPPAATFLPDVNFLGYLFQFGFKIRGSKIFFVDVIVFDLPLIQELMTLCDFILGGDSLEIIVCTHNFVYFLPYALINFSSVRGFLLFYESTYDVIHRRIDCFKLLLVLFNSKSARAVLKQVAMLMVGII